MAKTKTTAFFCSQCGYESSKWLGQCPGCRQWNTFVEEPVVKSGRQSAYTMTDNFSGRVKPAAISQISIDEEDRVLTDIAELDRVLGGGIVKGSLTLVGGDPGIGKSTLLLQVCRNISAKGRKVLYVSGEESLKQIKLRADRIGQFTDNLLLLSENNLAVIESVIKQEQPYMVVVDSIQTIYNENVDSAPGSVSQVRESTNILLQLAKGLMVSIFIVGHVTKEGVVAGPRVLEHMVDTVLYFEGDRQASYRILRGVKNRFGSTNEIGVFEMCQEGLKEVLNPSEFMINGRQEGASGSVVACTLEGSRPMMVEIQALVCKTNFGMPRRTAVGIDYNRVNLLIAVLEKRMGYHLSEYDAYVNMTGGVKLCEPALDLGVIMAVVSSYRDIPIDQKTIVFGEIGLSGEVRAVSGTVQRISEAKKLGFTRCILPQVSMNGIKAPQGIELIGVKNIKEAVSVI